MCVADALRRPSKLIIRTINAFVRVCVCVCVCVCVSVRVCECASV